MKTDDLIALMAADTQPEPSPAPTLAWALPLTLALSMAGLMAGLGLRRRADLLVSILNMSAIATRPTYSADGSPGANRSGRPRNGCCAGAAAGATAMQHRASRTARNIGLELRRTLTR